MLVLPVYGDKQMQTSTSKLTKKYQATIPEPVRRLLHLEAGDAIAFDIEDDTVRLRKARPMDIAFAESLENTLTEWTSEADEEAYRDL
jgi:AbrB family looped-hinge helix DNA binding protein